MIVTVYTKPGCQPCKATLRRITGSPTGALSVHRPGVQLVILDAREYAEDLRLRNMMEAPVVEVQTSGRPLANGTTYTAWSGYRPDLIDSLLPNPEDLS